MKEMEGAEGDGRGRIQNEEGESSDICNWKMNMGKII